jgi:tetratricopeptide (TPR) repeat protein
MSRANLIQLSCRFRRSLCLVALLSTFLCSVWAADVPANSTEAAKKNNLGVALMNQQLTEKAVAQFDAAHAADPKLPIPLLNRGIGLLYLEKLPEAQEALDQARALDPDNPHIWYSLGLVQRSAGKPKLAIEAFQHVTQIDPTDADAHYFLGSTYLEVQDFQNAVDQFEAALKINPIHASAEFNLARANQRLQKMDVAREHLKRYEHLTHDKISSPLTSTYGEQGHYSLVMDILSAEPAVGPMIPISLVQQSWPSATTPAAHSASPDQQGGGACILDLGGSTHKDLVLLGSGDHAIRAYRNKGNSSFEEIPDSQTGLAAKGTAIACTVGDYDNDGLPDIAIAMSDRVLVFHNQGSGKFTDVTTALGITPRNLPAGLTWIDFDHDGDLDLFVTGSVTNSTGSTPNTLWRNNGNSTFTEWTEPTGLGGTASTLSAVLSDLNNDRAVDLLVTGSTPAPTFYSNPREGHFKPLPLYQENLPPTTGAYITDFDKDGWMDVAVTHSGAPGLTLWRNVKGKSFERIPLPLSDATRAWGVTAIDIDNDGWIDLAAIIDTAHGPELRVFRNRGPQGFEDISKSLGLDKIKLHDPRSVIAIDIDNDGAADLIVTQLNGPPVILHNQGGNKNHSLRIDLAGLADNKSGLGTKVEVFAGGLWQKWEVAGGSGYLSQGPTEILAGLGTQEHADIVRMLWPTGVPQDEIDLPPGNAVAFKELDRRGSSCPVLFAWDGAQYKFVTDVIGAAVIGHWVSPTSTNKADADEWVKVEGSQLKQRNGLFSLRFGEPMEEINFVDQVRLVAIDHPEGTDVYPDERFLSEPPFASGRTIVAAAPRPVAGAWDDKGRDVSATLLTRDHQYVRDFTNLNYAGYANMHTLTLDLGEWTPANPLRLLLSGFVEYFSASSMYSAWQAGISPIPPYVEAQLPDGSWRRVIEDMGFPAGLPRTIVVVLTGKLPPGTRRIRMTTNLQIYWDRAQVDNAPDASHGVRQTELPLATAHLAFRGYPQQVDGATPGDLNYRYDRISLTGPFAWQRGAYTRYGNVTPLLKSVDDHYVIFGSGEEIDTEFSASALPPLQKGWKRDYFFYANGFVKDMDFYEALPFTVADLPFHGESRYPYSRREHYPDTNPAVNYRLDWNNRFETGNRKQPFRFNYQPAALTPDTRADDTPRSTGDTPAR